VEDKLHIRCGSKHRQGHRENIPLSKSCVKHIFNLQMNNVNAGKYKLMVYDARGRVVISRDIEHFGGSSTQQILLPNGTASGAYRVVLLSNEKSIFSTTLIVAD
jgi:hypothetical protein